MNFSNENPFNGQVPDTVPLPNTPLTGVLVQVMFPEILSIENADFVAPFQEKIRARYPIVQQEQNLVLQISPEGSKQSKTPNWRFFDVERKWRISLTRNFIAMETRAYDSRSDFTSRISEIALALAETINPNILTRIGVRYVDRIHGDTLSNIDQFVRSELLGLYTPKNWDNINHTMSEIVGETDVGIITSRCGYMPQHQTHEPDLMPAIGVPSWFLDIDVYQEFDHSEEFNSEFIEDITMKLATRAYGFFRWATNSEFLKTYGGDI